MAGPGGVPAKDISEKAGPGGPENMASNLHQSDSTTRIQKERENVRKGQVDIDGAKAPPRFSEGPPVVLFPSLAGSVLECHESPVEG